MSTTIWSFALAAAGILGIYLAGRKSMWGWAVGVGAQALWIVFAVVTHQWGFILSALAYGWVYGLNWWKWGRERRLGSRYRRAVLAPLTDAEHHAIGRGESGR